MKTWIFLIRADPACIAHIRPECELLTEYVFPSPIRYEDLCEILHHASTAFGWEEGNNLPRGILCLYGDSTLSAPVPITPETLKILCAILGGVETAAADDKSRRHLPTSGFKGTTTSPIVIRMLLTTVTALQGQRSAMPIGSITPPLPYCHTALPAHYEVAPFGQSGSAQFTCGNSSLLRPEVNTPPMVHARPVARSNELSGIFESARQDYTRPPFSCQDDYCACRTNTAPLPSSPVPWRAFPIQESPTNSPSTDVSVAQLDSGIIVASRARRGASAISQVADQRCFEARGPRPLLQVLGVLERSSALSAEMFAALLLQFMPTIYQRVQKKVGKMNKSSLSSILSWFNPMSSSGMLEALSRCIAIMEQDPELSRHATQLKDILDGRPGALKIGTLLVDCLRTFSEFPFATQARTLLSLAPHLLPVWRQTLSWCSTTGPDDAEPGQVTLSEITHWGHNCAACGLRNIYGPRFRCDSCQNRSYDLCGPCHLRKYEVHDGSHLFRCLFRDVRHPQMTTQDPRKGPDHGAFTPQCPTPSPTNRRLQEQTMVWNDILFPARLHTR